MEKSNRVIFNTFVLYVKMIITIFVSLYSTRLILNSLGVKDFGIYNLIGGVIAMLSFLQVSMSSSTQRYLSFHKGTGNHEILKKIFSSSVTLHFFIGFIIVILLEIFGLFFLNGSLNIPSDRSHVATIVFHLMVVSTFLTINSVPYEGALNANENMTFISLLGIFEVILKLLGAILLYYVTYDKLLFYAGTIVIITLACRLISVYYCRLKYEECRGGFNSSNVKYVKEMLSFSGWNSFGALCSIGRNQGIAIVLNMFFGVIVNASYGIANQVSSQLGFFSQSMLMALRPQIVKSEGEGEREKMLKLSTTASKFSLYFMALVSIPFLVEMPFILRIWLGNVPESSILFCRLVIVLNLIVQISTGLMIAIQSAGNIKYYQAVVGTFVLLTLPVGYMLFHLKYPSYSILIVAIIIEIISTFLRLIFAKNLINMSIITFLYEVILKGLMPIVLTLIPVIYIHSLISNEWIRFLIVGCSSVSFLILIIYYIGLNLFEKEIILRFSKTFINRFSRVTI